MAGVTHSLPTASPSLGSGGYEQTVARIREVVQALLPATATVLVVSKGDGHLLRLGGRRGWHFPQMENGEYAGHHPGSSEEAIEQLERLRNAGANYLLFPSTAFWWFGHYESLARHLTERYELVLSSPDTCVIFALDGHVAGNGVGDAPMDRYRQSVEQVRDLVETVLPDDASVLVISRGDDRLVELDGRRARHFPQDATGGHRASHPANAEEAILELEKLREHGAEFLVVPATESWWLDHYGGFRRHLETRNRLVLDQRYVCTIYELEPKLQRAEAIESRGRPLWQKLRRLWRGA
jgi:hypothetical protein